LNEEVMTDLISFALSLCQRLRAFRILLCFPLFFYAGCSQRTVSSVPTTEVYILEGLQSTNWFSLNELRQTSDRVLAMKGVSLAPKDLTVTVTVSILQNSNRVFFNYFSGYGSPAYLVELDPDGNVMAYTNDIATPH
jgi:hypothetical protein